MRKPTILMSNDMNTKCFSHLSATYFSPIFDQLDAIVLVIDSESFSLVYANNSAKKKLTALSGKKCWQLLHGENAEPCRLCRESQDSTNTSKSYNIFNKDNNCWYKINEWPVVINNKKVHIHIAIDITRDKYRSETLLLDKNKYQTVADSTYDWECWLSAQKKLDYISPSCKRTTGYTPDDFNNNPKLIYTIVHPSHRNDFKAHHEDEKFFSPAPQHLEYRILTKDGETKWLSHYCQPVYAKDGTFLGRRSSDRDITTRVIAEEKTKLNEQRLSLLLQLYEKKSLPTKEICDFVLEASLPLTSSSVGFLGFLDAYETEVTIHAWSGNVMNECNVHGKPFVFNIENAGLWAEGIYRKRPVIINDFRQDTARSQRMPKGHVTINNYLTVPLIIDEKVVAIISVSNKEDPFSDDDAHQLQLLLEGMWQMLSRKRAENESLKHSQKIQQFARTVAHDLKNPAISSYGFAKRFLKEYGDKLDERGRKYIDQILKSTEQIFSLAEDINVITTTREAPPTFDALNLPDVWNITHQEFILQLKERNIQWLEPQVTTIPIIANKLDILRVFRNIVQNALKYGGKNLSTIHMGYEVSKTHHILSIGNNGQKIPPDDENIIFQEFGRSKQHSKIAGTGLGLSIVTEIAKKHQGRSWLGTKNGSPVFYISIARKLTSS